VAENETESLTNEGQRIEGQCKWGQNYGVIRSFAPIGSVINYW